jgi:signal transduction histidine kinase
VTGASGHGSAPDRPQEFEPLREPTARRAACRRLALVVAAMLAFIGASDVIEWVGFPERRRAIAVSFAVALAIGGGLVAVSRKRSRRAIDRLGATVVVLLLGYVGWYNEIAGNQPDRLAMALAVNLCSLAVLLATPWRLQLACSVAALGVFAWVAPAMPVPPGDGLFFPVLGVAIGGFASVFGAALLERHRLDAEEEACINAALLQVGETLDRHLGDPDMLERVSRHAAWLLGCDWAHVFLREDDRSAVRLHASHGLPAEMRTELAQLSFRFADIPLLRALRPGVVIPIEDRARQQLVPLALLQRFGIASALWAAISRGSEVRGVFVAGYCMRTGEFSRMQRRIAIGVAHLTSLALENVRLIEKLQAASRLKSEFVATMSHELRTPLNVINGFADLLAEGALGDLEPPQLAALHKLRRSARQLGALIDETLDLGRLEAGRERIDAVDFDVGGLFAELAAEVDGLGSPEVALSGRDDVGAQRLRGDRVKLKTILKNLVGNALKFTPAGEVEVSAYVAGDAIAFGVRDTGIGIAEQDVPVIFEMFRQLDGSPARAFEGVGLGLHIVARLTALLGGQVHVDSAPGRGSTFTVELPLLDERREEAQDLAEPATAGGAAGSRRPCPR